MKRRDFLRATAVSAGNFAVSARSASRLPNILLLFADQHNAGVLGCAGHEFARTPNLDRLAREGVRFDRTYCQDGICVPSRTSLMTGQYCRTTGVLDNPDRPPLVAELQPLHRHLKQQGYLTASIGKRHLPQGLREGFDYTATTISPKQDPSEYSYESWLDSRGKTAAWQRDRTGGGSPLGCHVTQLDETETAEYYTAQKTMEFLGQARQAGKPFFCWSSFLRPHQPYTPATRWAGLYDPTKIKLPGSLRQPVSDLPPLLQNWRGKTDGLWCLARAAADERIYRTYVAYYYSLVTEVDHHIGNILKTLEKEGLAENTLIVYTADHGDFVAAHGMVEKCALGHNVYEDTLRVPLIVHWPGRVQRGVVRRDLVESVDLYPTLLDLAGLDRPKTYSLPGRSLAAAVTKGERVAREYAISENWSQVSVITTRYKLGHWLQAPEGRHDYRSFGDMLFDREADPLETHNLAGKAEVASVEKQLRSYIDEWSRRTPAKAKELNSVPQPRKGKK